MITAEFIQGTRPKAAESLSKSDWGLRTEKESEPSHKQSIIAWMTPLCLWQSLAEMKSFLISSSWCHEYRTSNKKLSEHWVAGRLDFLRGLCRLSRGHKIHLAERGQNIQELGQPREILHMYVSIIIGGGCCVHLK